MTASRTSNIITVAAAVGTAIALAIFFLNLSSALPSDHEEYRIKALLPDVSGLSSGANVTIAGLRVGRVESVQRRDGMGVITLSVGEDNAPVPTDTRFGVRLRTVVGEQYLELYPGRSKNALPEGGVLTQGMANEYVDVDKILDTLRGSTRRRARDLIQGVGTGVRGQGPELNRVLHGASGVISTAKPLFGALAAQRREIARLVDELGVVTAEVGERGDALRDLARSGRATAVAVAARDDALRGMIERMPGTLRQVRRTTATIDAVSTRTAPVVANLATAVHDLRPTVRNLRPAAVEGQAVLRELGRVARPLQGTLDRVVKLERPIAKALPAVRQTLCEFNPMAKYLKPFSKDILGVIQGMGSSGNYYDANGHAARLMVTFGEGSARGIPQNVSDAMDVLLKSGAAAQSYSFGYDPYPGAGNAGQTAGPATPASIGKYAAAQRYPHVEAEC